MENIKQVINNPTTYNNVLSIYSTFPILFTAASLLINAPYGRFAYKPGSFNNSLSRYAWLTMEIISPLTFLTTFYIIIKENKIDLIPSQYLCFLLWFIHYFNRSIIYSLRAPSISSIHIITWLCSIFFNLVNGYTNGYWVATHPFSLTSTAEWSRVSFGLLLWCFGFLSNHYHDSILFALRKNTPSGVYSIPHGGLFTFISCPNYFSESIEWIGFFLICWSTPSLYFALSTMANLFPRAYRSHQWYKKKFDNYPTNRNAVIPFLF